MPTVHGIDEPHLYQILEAERPRLVRLCAYLTGEADAAEDVAQEVLIEAWRHIAQLRDPQALHAWLSGIARNVSARWLRSRGRESAVFNNPDQEIDQQARDFDLEVALERHELSLLLDRALDLLPEETRAVLIQRYVEESSLALIADQLGLSENLVAVRLHRGKLALRHLLATELRAEAESFGLLRDLDHWQETRIWCSFCGQHRLRGKLDDAEFVLRCPGCASDPRDFHAQSVSTPLLMGMKSFRPALNRFSAWMHDVFQTAIAKGSVICERCGKQALLRYGLPDYAPPSLHARKGLHIRCPHCGMCSYATIDGLALNFPEARQFWREHGRIRTLPERQIDVAGIPALLIRFESVAGEDRLDVIVRRDSYGPLATRGGDHD